MSGWDQMYGNVLEEMGEEFWQKVCDKINTKDYRGAIELLRSAKEGKIYNTNPKPKLSANPKSKAFVNQTRRTYKKSWKKKNPKRTERSEDYITEEDMKFAEDTITKYGMITPTGLIDEYDRKYCLPRSRALKTDKKRRILFSASHLERIKKHIVFKEGYYYHIKELNKG